MLHADRIYVFGSHDIETQQICDGIGCLMYSGLQQHAYRRLCVALRSTLRSCFIWSWVRNAPNMQGGQFALWAHPIARCELLLGVHRGSCSTPNDASSLSGSARLMVHICIPDALQAKTQLSGLQVTMLE